VLQQEVVVADAHDPVDFAGECEAAGRRALGRIHDRPREGLLERDDLELLMRMARRAATHH
jgi:hypothetical protein